jgi:uroporphyrinogen III methyltransferase/synthase
MNDSASQPLAGKKVVVTRAREQAGKFVQMLEDLGAVVIEFPTIEIRPVQPPPAIPPLRDFDWVIVTSANAGNALLDALNDGHPDGDLRNCRVCAIGPGTSSELRRRGVKVDLVPGDHIQEGIVEALKDFDPLLSGKHILLPKGDLSREYLADELRKLGASVCEIVVYHTIRVEASADALRSLLDSAPDAITFTSASTARHFARIVGAEGLAKLAGTVFASIGPETSAEARACGIRVDVEPAQHDLWSLAGALADHFIGLRH